MTSDKSPEGITDEEMAPEEDALEEFRTFLRLHADGADFDAEMVHELSLLLDELRDRRKLFEVQWNRSMEANKLWQAEDPENRKNTWPDLGELLKWLMAGVHKGRAVKAVLKERERELLELKGSCANQSCPLHYAHSGPCSVGENKNLSAYTPPYVHDILDSWFSGEPLNFRMHRIPDEVEKRLSEAKQRGELRGVPAVEQSSDRSAVDLESQNADGMFYIYAKTSDDLKADRVPVPVVPLSELKKLFEAHDQAEKEEDWNIAFLGGLLVVLHEEVGKLKAKYGKKEKDVGA